MKRRWNHNIEKGQNDRCEIYVESLQRKKLAEDIIADLLQLFVRLAQAQSGSQVKKVVVTVPVYYTDTQR